MDPPGWDSPVVLMASRLRYWWAVPLARQQQSGPPAAGSWVRRRGLAQWRSWWLNHRLAPDPRVRGGVFAPAGLVYGLPAPSRPACMFVPDSRLPGGLLAPAHPAQR